MCKSQFNATYKSSSLRPSWGTKDAKVSRCTMGFRTEGTKLSSCKTTLERRIKSYFRIGPKIQEEYRGRGHANLRVKAMKSCMNQEDTIPKGVQRDSTKL